MEATRLQADLTGRAARYTHKNAAARSAWLVARSRTLENMSSPDKTKLTSDFKASDGAAGRSAQDDFDLGSLDEHDKKVAVDRIDYWNPLNADIVPESSGMVGEGSDCGGVKTANDWLMSGRYGSAVQTRLGAYFTPTRENVESIKAAMGSDAVVLDPLAGKGWAGEALRGVGVPVIMSDDKSWATSKTKSDEIEDLDAVESARKHAASCSHILISWAPGDDVAGGDRKTDREIIEEAKKINPSIKIAMISQEYVEPRLYRMYDTYSSKVGSNDARRLLLGKSGFDVHEIDYDDVYHITKCNLPDSEPHW